MQNAEGIKQDFDLESLVDGTMSNVKSVFANLNHLNIIVAGKTGVGKSTLVNAVFGKEIARTGEGKPVTQHLEKYHNENTPLTIYDTKGLELSAEVQNSIFSEITDTIATQQAKNDINESIHCLWYCISAASNRVEEEEIKLLKEFSNERSLTQVPIIVIITKCYNKKTIAPIKEAIEAENLKLAGIIPVHSINYCINDEYEVNPFGLEDLMQKMTEVLPEQLQTTFINIQKISLELKIEHARKMINRYMVTASGLAATPVPFSDAFTLIPTQIGMIAHITSCFGLSIDKSILTGFISAVAGTTATTFIGKAIVSNLLKLIPGIGSVAGGVISASTAGLLTKALGEAYIALMVKIEKGELALDEVLSEEGKRILAQLVKEKLNTIKISEILK